MAEHPITPPPELVQQWVANATGPDYEQVIATQAARWGDDQRLKACCEWVRPWRCEDRLRAAMRPEPPSLKEQALEQLDGIATCFRITHGGDIVCDKIRRALQELPE